MKASATNKPLKEDSRLLYMKIAMILEDDIASGRLTPGSRLPTENEFCRRFRVSRHTAREALRHLREGGWITSRQGSGSVVVGVGAAGKYTHSVTSLTELMQYGRETTLEIEGSKMIVADSRLASRLECSPGRRWLCIEGIRRQYRNDPPIGHSQVFVHAAYSGIRSYIGKKPGPIYRWIEQMYGERITQVVQTMRATTIEKDLALKLQAPPNSAAFEVERVYRSAKHRVIQVSFNIHPADRFSYSLVLRHTP